MIESSKIGREYRRVATNMNVPSVDEYLYMRVLRNRDVHYDTRLSTFDNENSKPKQPNSRLNTFDNLNRKTKKPNIPHKCSSLTRDHKLATADLSLQLPNDINQSKIIIKS